MPARAGLAEIFGEGARVERTERIHGGQSSVTEAVDLRLADGSVLPPATGAR